MGYSLEEFFKEEVKKAKNLEDLAFRIRNHYRQDKIQDMARFFITLGWQEDELESIFKLLEDNSFILVNKGLNNIKMIGNLPKNFSLIVKGENNED